MNRNDVRVLSFHARYRCRDSGVCCSSDWPIAVEADRLRVLETAIADGKLLPMLPAGGSPFVMPFDAPADSPAVLTTQLGRCVFHEAGRCRVHTALGHQALPLACRQFPRTSVIDPRGVSVTLSHYCPTASSLLLEEPEQDQQIVVNAPAFPANGEYIGLDAGTALPPLLRRDMLMDWESWWLFEQLAVDVVLQTGARVSEAMSVLRDVVTRTRAWSLTDGPLVDTVRASFASPSAVETAKEGSALIAAALQAIPEPLRARAHWTEATATDDRVARRFLAAHAFANWAIHLGPDGLLSWLRSIETAHAFLTAGAGVSHTDLVLRHLIDVNVWTRRT